MKLRILRSARWSVLGVCDERGTCLVTSFIKERLTSSQNDRRQITALLDGVAAYGPPRSASRFRQLDGPIYELKTRSGVRIPCFLDEDRVVICAEALRKPKARQLAGVIDRARVTRSNYMLDKRRGAIHIVEEEQ